MKKTDAQGIVFGAFIAVLAVFAGFKDYIIPLPIALGILNGYVNNKMVDKFKVGKVYHGVQVAALTAIMGTLIWTKLVAWEEALLMTMFYWIPFELSLNKFRGRMYDYIGESGWFDNTLRGWFKSYAVTKTFLTGMKVLLTVAGFTWYMWNKGIGLWD